MLDALTAVLADVGNNAVSVRKAFESGNLGNYLKDFRGKMGGVLRQLVRGRDVLLGNDQNMRGRLGGDIAEGVNIFVLIDLA